MSILSNSGFRLIAFQNYLKKAHPRIPFKDPPYGVTNSAENISYAVFYKTNQITSITEAEDSTEFKNRAVKNFIEHYFPEFYPFIVDQKTDVVEYEEHYLELKEELYDSLNVKKVFKKPNPIMNKVVYTTDLDLWARREQLMESGALPPFEKALDILNTSLTRGAPASVATFKFENAPDKLQELNGALTDFATLLGQFQQKANVGVNFNSAQQGAHIIVRKIIDSVYDSIDFRSRRETAYDTDYFTVRFDANTQIVGIDYFVLSATVGETVPSTIGYITNIKYNPVFKDILLLRILKNYQEILDATQQRVTGGNQFPMMSLFERLGLPGADTLFGGQTLVGDPVFGFGQDNPFAPRNADSYVDVSDYGDLAKAFKNGIMSEEEVLRFEEMQQNPAFKRKILQAQKAKRINTTIQVFDVMDRILNFNFPLFGPNLSPATRTVNRILSMFGIQEMAKEALICLTLGMGATASRITSAVRDSLVDGSVPFNSPPTLPSREVDLKRPNLKSFFEQFKPKNYFSVTADASGRPLHVQIRDTILSTLANAAFEMVKELTQLIQFNCADILESLRGDIDVGEELRTRNSQAAGSLPNLAAKIADELGSLGMTPEEGYEYLSALSPLLTPIDVCGLLNSPLSISEDVISNILIFNETYYLAAVNNNISNRTTVSAVFQAMSSNIDTVSFCNDIINENVAASLEGCQICLDVDLFAANPAIQTLTDIAENGMPLPVPPLPDFFCPDKDTYLANPIAQRVIPGLFNQIVDSAAIYMGASLASARTSLLEPVISADMDPNQREAFEVADVDIEEPSINPDALDFITGLFEFMQNLGEDVLNPATCPDIEDEKFQSFAEDMQLIVNAVNAGLLEVPGVVEEIAGEIDSIKTNLASPGGFPHVEYEFPAQFKNDFEELKLMPVPSTNEGYYLSNGNRLSDPEHPTLYGSIYGYQVKFDNLDDTYQYTNLDFTFNGGDKVSINYLPYNSFDQDFLRLNYNLSSLGFDGQVNTLVMPDYSTPPTDFPVDLQLNPYIYRFAKNPWESGTTADQNPTAYDLRKIVGEGHAGVYGSLVSSVANYILENGTFSAATINNLSLLKNNANCPPENVGDLFDAEGIINQMQREFAAAACHDQGGSNTKVRNTLYFGLINMLIQTIIDEFIVSNIMVFGAFSVKDLLDPRYPFKDFMVNQVVKAINGIVTNGNIILEQQIHGYFNRTASRPSTQSAGGVAHSYATGSVVPGFETPDYPANTADLIKFMVDERVGYIWNDGNRSTIKAINNVFDPQDQKQEYESIFLKDIVGVYSTRRTAQYGAFNFAAYTDVMRGADAEFFLDDPDLAYNILRSLKMPTKTVFIVDTQAVFIIYYATYESNDVTNDIEYLEIPLATIGYPSAGFTTFQDKLNFIRTTEEYQLLFNQAFNKDAILMVSILYNFFLTKKYFSDMSDSFITTKSAILQMMDMTNNSQYPPDLPVRTETYVAALANNGEQDINSMARDIALKFAMETPTLILRGVLELIDPHVSISAKIRDLTAAALGSIAQGINLAIQTNPALEPLRKNNITGEDLFGIVFCAYSIGNSALQNLIPEDSPVQPENTLLFGPKLSMKGVDFTGTIAGMLMVPPSPLGIVYILLELLKIDIKDELGTDSGEDTENAADTEVDECVESPQFPETTETETE